MSRKVIVSGGGGFIGSRLVHHLVDSGYEVAALGRRPLDALPTFRRNSLTGSLYLPIDIEEDVSLRQMLLDNGFVGEDLCYVFHLAWAGSSRLSDLDVEAQGLNVDRTVGFYQLATELGAERFIFSGTMEEEFALQYTELDYRTESKYNRHVVYALAKIAAGDALKLTYRPGDPELLFANNSHVMGPGDDKDSFLQVALRKFMYGEEIIMSTGEQNFDVIQVDDCAKAYLAIAERGRSGQTYWVGSGKPQSLREYIEQMQSRYPDVNVRFGELPYNDVRLELETFDISRLIRDTGFRPETTFLEAVDDLARHFELVSESENQV
jgi:nucleoside-diphosphate-sugar epimerase